MINVCGMIFILSFLFCILFLSERLTLYRQAFLLFLNLDNCKA